MKKIVIHPYRQDGFWQFDDPTIGVRNEGLLRGMDRIIEVACHLTAIRLPERGFTLTVADAPFPGAMFILEWRSRDVAPCAAWNIYEFTAMGMRGSLCPVLGIYFGSPPPQLFICLENGR